MARTSKKAKSAEDSVGPEGPVDILEEDVSHPGIVDASPQYKEDINAFSIPVEEDKEFISGMPSEILDEILSYLILDHDPELAAKVHSPDPKLRENPHVLLSLAAMSRHFRDHVEDFSRRHLTTHKQMYSFKTTAELEAVKIVRRSDRLKEKPTRDHRCYRFELVSRLRWRCIQCNAFSGRRATMANGVGFVVNTNLSNAKELYDLRDWMLIPSRNPRLRAKHPNLPVITYGTVRTGTPYYNGMTTSYRFFRKDVEMLGKAVHVHLGARMEARSNERRRRKIQKRDKEHVKLKIRYHQEQLADAESEKKRKRHQQRLDYYSDPERKKSFKSTAIYKYGQHDDVHRRLCIRENCPRCDHEKRVKYSPEFWKDMWMEDWEIEREYMEYMSDDDDDEIWW